MRAGKSHLINGLLRCIPPDNGGIRDDESTPVYGGIQGPGGAGSAAGRQDTIQQIAAKHKVHPNQVSAWKRQAVDGLGEVFSNGANRACRDHESEVRDLHAKIGELTVERDFLARGLKR